MNGGTFANNGNGLTLGDLAGSSGTLNVNGGTLTVGATIVGARGSGTITQTAGTVTVTGASNSLSLGFSTAASQGTYNLNGGSLVAPAINGFAGTSTFNFNSGTLKPVGNSVGFLSLLKRVNVRNGGAIFNTDSFTVSTAQPLLHSNIGGDAALDGGLAKNGLGTLTLSGVNTYTGATTVNTGTLRIDGSTATGATAVKNGAALDGSGTLGGNVTVEGGGMINGPLRVNGLLTVNSGGLASLTGGGTLTAAGGLNNSGFVRLLRGAALTVPTGASFTNNGVLDVITGSFSAPAGGFSNTGTVLDASIVKIKTFNRAANGSSVSVQIDGYPAHSYRLQRSASLASNSFAAINVADQSVPAAFSATPTLLTFTDLSPPASSAFYRVVVDP